VLESGANGRQLANKIERSVHGSDAGYDYHHCSDLFTYLRVPVTSCDSETEDTL